MYSGKMLTFQDFVHTIQLEVQETINQSITDPDIRYAMEGGKLLRPVMLILSYKACANGSDIYYSNALESALGMELAHAASLVHDDIMDDDDTRRGKLALHVKKGMGNAILTGHRMISTAFRISVEHGLENALIFPEREYRLLNPGKANPAVYRLKHARPPLK